MPKINYEKCTICEKCVYACPIDAITTENEKIVINKEVYLGCGVCVRSCPRTSLSLQRREKEIITPVNLVHRTVLMAIKRGKLPNLIFENQDFGSHRAMAAVLPPIYQMMASKQMKSRYLDKMISKLS